jgi:hypothetical protein
MKSVHEVHSDTTARKAMQGEATAGVRGLARDAGRQPSENNLRLLDLFDPLDNSSGNLQCFKRRTRGASGALDEMEVGIRKAEVGMRFAVGEGPIFLRIRLRGNRAVALGKHCLKDAGAVRFEWISFGGIFRAVAHQLVLAR